MTQKNTKYHDTTAVKQRVKYIPTRRKKKKLTSSKKEHLEWPIQSIQFIIIGLLLRRIGKLLLPHVVRCVLVQPGKKKIKHVGVPSYSMAFDTLLDILYRRREKSLVSLDSYTPMMKSCMCELTSGSSSQSDMLSAGKIICLAPARRAATVFSRNPPIRRTLPVTVSSPVMAKVGSRGWFSANDNSELAIVIPAEGPIAMLVTLGKKKR